MLEASGTDVPVEYIGTLDKVYCFFKDGHVQNMSNIPDHICITAVALSSLRKHHTQNATVFIYESASVVKACCSYPAELAGYCNHATATLYRLEDYIKFILVFKKMSKGMYKPFANLE